jgi:ribose/xylose/arabinose/galactoside ABC-type transport system permease subunit
MISFAKIFSFTFMIAIAGQLLVLAGVFPHQLSVDLSPVQGIYSNIMSQLAVLQKMSGQDILSQLGSYGYIMLLMIQLVLSVTLLAPVFTGNVINALFGFFGFPPVIGTLFMTICYMSFVLWIVDVIRSREVGR